MSALRTSIREAAAIASLEIAKVLGIIVAYYPSDLNAISLYASPGSESVQGSDQASIDSDSLLTQISIPIQAGIYASIYQIALTSNVATATTRNAHGMQVGMPVRVEMNTGYATFDGRHKISVVPSTTSFSWAKTNANIASADLAGSVEAIFQSGEKIVIAEQEYQIGATKWDSFRTAIVLDLEQVQARKMGVLR